ncbi:MAG: glycoside hydrolase family 1 protein [Candidatus Omnitrophota bacterium]
MKKTFPENFLWGASTSAHQVEGENMNNDWWEWEKNGNTEPSGKACDHYTRFKNDFETAKKLGHNAHRLGIEWARLEKQEGIWDQSEWDHYKEVLKKLRGLNIEPIVTLNHFTVPLWLARKGSWTNPESVFFFERFALKAIQELGSLAKYWITINEPHMLAFISYFYGKWTPCVKSPEKAFTVLTNMLKAHARSYRIMHEAGEAANGIIRPEIGIAKAVAAFHPYSFFSLKDRLAARNRSKFHNHCFILSALKGRVLIPGREREPLCCKKTLDFIGLNYYYRQFIHEQKNWLNDPLGGISQKKHKDENIKTDMGWEIYPRGLYEVIKSFSKYRLPVMITENGLATTDDSLRKKFIKQHLYFLLKAMDEGANVTGYLHWSLLDNFEWAEGYSKRFGLVEVNFDSMERAIRDSARYYESVIRSGKIE